MVEASTDLVTYNSGGVTASATASAEADAVAQFDLRRGLRLSAEARAHSEAHLSAALGSDPSHASLLASVQASLGVSARLALAAQLDVHGLWAEACAAAEARARIQGDIKVTGQMLLDALGADPGPHGVMGPVTAFLRQVQVDAGVYAEAYFAVRARARLMVTGSVIPVSSDSDHAGFTVAFDYGYAYIWGAGISGFLTVGIPDVPTAVGATVEAAVTEVLRLLPADTPEEVEPLLRMLVPLSAAAAVAVGKALGKPQTGEPGPTPAVGDLATAFLTELRTSALNLVLTSLVELGVNKARDRVSHALDGAALTDSLRVDAMVACDSARNMLAELATAETVAQTLPPLISVCDALAQFCTDAATDLPELAEVAEVLTVAAAAGGGLYQVLGYDPSPVFPAALAARVRAATGATGPITVVQLVEYAAERVAGLLGGAPLGPTGWLSDLLGATADDLLTVLWHLLDDTTDPAPLRQLAAKAAHAVVDQLTTHLRSWVDSLPPGDLRTLTQTIDPLLDVLETALPPLLTAANEPDATKAAQVRDELDTLLTGVFGAMVVRCLNHVVSPFFDRGQQQLQELAEHVDRRDPAFAEFFALANEADVVFRISPSVVSAALRETATMVGVAKETAFAGAVELMNAFVLLPAETSERRAQLAVLADSDDPRVGDARLREQLLDALFVKSTQFAVEMVPPSVRMTSLIALDQGPVPLVTLYQDAVQVGLTATVAISDAAKTTTDIAGIVAGLVSSGKVSAAQLAQLATDLKALVGDAADLVQEILDVVKTLTWPVFVTSSGGVGLFLRTQFDAFFADADWLVEEIRDRARHLVDLMVQALITVAQDVGVLDSGEGDDLGTLEQAVRQDALGDPAAPGLDLFDGKVQVPNAKIISVVTNATLARGDVRAKVRDFHTEAVGQAQRAQEAQLLLAPGAADATAAESAMRATLAAQQRDTGFTFTVTVEGLDNHAARPSGSKMDVVIEGAGLEFVSGPHPRVRVEIGGQSVAIDPVAWRVDPQGNLRGQFSVYADPLLGAPHPIAAEGLLLVAPPTRDTATGPTPPTSVATGLQDRSAELSAVRAVEQQHLASASDTSLGFLTYSAGQQTPAGSPAPEDFLPPVLADTGHGRRFPAVLELDRAAMLSAAPSSAVATAIGSLPGTAEAAFISASVLDDLQAGGGPASLTAEPGLAALLRTQASSSSGRSPVCVVARARPGYTTVTATVCAVPKQGQDATTTPRGQAVPNWFALNDDAMPAPDHNDAAFESQGNVPTVMRRGSTQQVTVTMRNTGNTTWSAADGYRLGAYSPAGNDVWGTTWQVLSAPVPPAGTATFSFVVQAPSASGPVFQWRMAREDPARGREWFGSPSTAVVVALVWDDAAFRSQNVPATIIEGTSATVTVTMLNSGTTTWAAGAGYQLGALGNDFGTPRHPLPAGVTPGQPASFQFSISAPAAPSVSFQWRMLVSGQWFGAATPSVQVARQASPQKVKVPNVIDADPGEAADAIRAVGLVPLMTGVRGQDTRVSIQTPNAGTIVTVGTSVTCVMQRVPPPPP
jgi:hypothetical protein